MKDPHYIHYTQKPLFAKSGNSHAVLMRQTPLDFFLFFFAFLQGANLSCLFTICRMFKRPSNLLLALGGHYEERQKKYCNIDIMT